MAICRQQPPHPLTGAAPSPTLYELALSQVPSAAWQAAFLRPPAALTTDKHTPELCRVGLDGARVIFRTSPSQLHQWVHWIDRWIAYANSAVEG
jgi:hypothetical protein